MPHLLVLVPFGRAGGSYFLPSFVLVPVRVGGLFLALGLLSRQGECAFALFLRPVMLFPARHALTLSTAFLVSRPVAAAASVKARSERDICGAVPVPLWRDLRQLRSAELPSTQPCKTRFRIPLILKLVWLFGAPRGKLCG
ncbi:unnamed protein product [Prunus armeniaca]|uniref:Uncharacterized protein n=1 Tax=Prunus armeniaca TaxID=36596 RepID=A0A6J5VD98_PRUAR|nr:unnamed protein product [Prunus armeniaca]CAB4286211.1 unnamed protein product [Prunus armeniaca]CAB4302783.1 unnamed protein product [Prunus armeniaca]